MKKETAENYISSELLAAYLDGNATAEENLKVLNALAVDPELREVIRISQALDAEENLASRKMELLPMTAIAASCGEESYCCLECEKYILTRRHIPFDEKSMLSEAIHSKWQRQNGTALYNIGRHLEGHRCLVSRRYQCKLDDLAAALKSGADVIVAVDGGELRGNRLQELVEDLFIGQIPDHTVVVLSCDPVQDRIEVYDPDSPNDKDTYCIAQFMDAWADSKYYMVTVEANDYANYKPHPIDLSDVVLTEDLNELREAIAENAHEIWAENRQAEGWTYGPQRDDKLKQTPDMVPYNHLPESEKEYDRDMAMKTINLLRKLGYDLIKCEDTELYQVLKLRIQDSQQEFRCKNCGKVISRNQKFCDNCGQEVIIEKRGK